MKFVADNTPDAQKYHHGRKMTSDIIAQTLAKPGIRQWNFRGGSQKDHNSEISGQFHAVTLSSLL